jgi:hypothetical protein
MHSDWFNGIEILQGRWQHGEKVGYCHPRGLEKTLYKWDIYVPLVTKGLRRSPKALKLKLKKNVVIKRDQNYLQKATVNYMIEPNRQRTYNVTL